MVHLSWLKEEDWGIDDKMVVANKLNGGVLKTGYIQDKLLGKIGSDGGENNELVGNGVEDRYKQDRRLLILAPNWCKRNSWIDMCHNDSASWIAVANEAKGLKSGKLHRQNRKTYFKWNDVTSNWIRGIIDAIHWVM